MKRGIEMSIENIPAKARGFRMNAFIFGAVLALIYIWFHGFWAGTLHTIALVTPYLAGVGMFVGLLTIFGTILATLRKVRNNAGRDNAIWDCYIAIAVIGVTGYFLAACVQTFQPGGNPAELWTTGAIAAASFAALFGSGKMLRGFFIAGGK